MFLSSTFVFEKLEYVSFKPNATFIIEGLDILQTKHIFGPPNGFNIWTAEYLLENILKMHENILPKSKALLN